MRVIGLLFTFLMGGAVFSLGSTATISSAWWSNQVDSNLNGWYEAARLNWDPNVSDSSTLTVFERLYSRTNSANPWTLFHTTASHQITGSSTSDQQFVDIPEDPNKGNATLYDYLIEIYRTGVSTPDATASLLAHPEEGVPDLIIWGNSINSQFSTENWSSTYCSVNHGCVIAGTRRMLRFTTETRNIGKTDLYLGSPVNGPNSSLFAYDPCHLHYHLQSFATYRLLSSDNSQVVALGNKIGFCLEDTLDLDTNTPPNSPKYTCSDQGIQAGWGDVYGPVLSCQFIDITGVPPGNYNLEIHVNPELLFKEASSVNNITTTPVTVVNTMPTLTSIANRSIAANTTTASIYFTVWDGETAWNQLTITTSSSNTSLVPNGNIVLSPDLQFVVDNAAGTSGIDRFITITPAANQTGSTTITVTVSDANSGTATKNFVLSVLADNDQDGLPDNYELANGLNPNDPTDAAWDADGDGFTNLQEYLAGTNPQNPASTISITATEPNGSNVEISFKTVTGKLYRVERNDIFPADGWTAISSNLQGTGAIFTVTDFGASNQTTRFYRVQVLP